jgi:tripartite ATP-independent transporter DctM subunit
MPPLMFGGLVVFLIIGYPVAFSLCAVGFFFGFLSIEMGYFTMAFMQAIPGRVFGSILSNELLLAIPFFTFMGAILEKCGLAEDLLEGTGQLFGPMQGRAGLCGHHRGRILGAITGTVAASGHCHGLISLPIMMRYGYDMRYATGVIAASGTITQLIPPSLVLIVLADQLGKSVGDMYARRHRVRPSCRWLPCSPALHSMCRIVKPHGCRRCRPRRAPRGSLVKCAWGMVPSIVLIFLVLGTIFMGLATPTEAGAMGAVGAMVVRNAATKFNVPGRLRRRDHSASWPSSRLPWPLAVRQGMESTMRITAMVIFILLGATCSRWSSRAWMAAIWIEHAAVGPARRRWSAS